MIKSKGAKKLELVMNAAKNGQFCIFLGKRQMANSVALHENPCAAEYCCPWWWWWWWWWCWCWWWWWWLFDIGPVFTHQLSSSVGQHVVSVHWTLSLRFTTTCQVSILCCLSFITYLYISLQLVLRRDGQAELAWVAGGLCTCRQLPVTVTDRFVVG